MSFYNPLFNELLPVLHGEDIFYTLEDPTQNVAPSSKVCVTSLYKWKPDPLPSKRVFSRCSPSFRRRSSSGGLVLPLLLPMESRPPDLQPDVVPQPVEVFVPSFGNRAKREKSGIASSDKLNPRSTVKKPGISSGRRSSSRKASKTTSFVPIVDGSVSSEYEMILDEVSPNSGSAKLLEVIHPPPPSDVSSGFRSPSELISPVSVLANSVISCSTSFSDDSPLINGASVDLEMETHNPVNPVSIDLSVHLDHNSVLNVDIVDSNQFPPLSSVSPMLLASPTHPVTFCPPVGAPSLLGSPPRLKEPSASTPLVLVDNENAIVTENSLVNPPQAIPQTLPLPPEIFNPNSRSTEFSYAKVVKSNTSSRRVPASSSHYQNSTRGGNKKNHNGQKLISIGAGKQTRNPEGDMDGKVTKSTPEVQILQRSKNHSSHNCSSGVSPTPPPPPFLNSSVSVNSKTPQTTGPSSPVSVGVKRPASIYDFDPDGLAGKNKFEALNSIDESFNVLCEADGRVFPVEPLLKPSALHSIGIDLLSNVSPPTLLLWLAKRVLVLLELKVIVLRDRSELRCLRR
ncbi:hypothetical protein L1887_30918 [Cichorium endivia]|nr:hypothetical protein L1887_30918 [Cichorium endivia]